MYSDSDSDSEYPTAYKRSSMKIKKEVKQYRDQYTMIMNDPTTDDGTKVVLLRQLESKVDPISKPGHDTLLRNIRASITTLTSPIPIPIPIPMPPPVAPSFPLSLKEVVTNVRERWGLADFWDLTASDLGSVLGSSWSQLPFPLQSLVDDTVTFIAREVAAQEAQSFVNSYDAALAP
jgi:hypothetical protein